jgi:hypothetical protein
MNIGTLKFISNKVPTNQCYAINLNREDSLLINEPVKIEEHLRSLQIMKYTTTIETYEPLTSEELVVEQVPMSTKRMLPATPFPRKYVHSVFADLQDATQAALALRAAGFDKGAIHLITKAIP